jgi:hypothetical protein
MLVRGLAVNIRLGLSPAALMLVSVITTSAHAAEPTATELKQKEDEAFKAYEALRVQRLTQEIAEEELALKTKKAQLASLTNTTEVAGKPIAEARVATTSTLAPVEEVAKVAADTKTKVTTSTTTENGKRTESTSAELSQRNLAEGPAARDFAGIKFGIGIASTIDTGKYQRVREAELVNNIVRVKHSEQSTARVVLESHYFLTPEISWLNGVMRTLGVGENVNDYVDPTKRKANWGIGPFVALQPGTENVIDAIGTGFMIGLRRAKSGNDSFNLGIGVMVDVNARTLGNGILEDQPLAEGDSIRYKQRSQLGVLLMSSYSF